MADRSTTAAPARPGRSPLPPDGAAPAESRETGADAVAPSDLTSRQLATLTTTYSEIGSLAYEARYDAGTVTPRSSPPVPAASADPPGILTLNRVAFYYTP